uniref:Uncharacterized protein n=1 Tax=Solanum lycopersicum TaxID=4081 RepID=A0A3Q7EE64_SOLLC
MICERIANRSFKIWDLGLNLIDLSLKLLIVMMLNLRRLWLSGNKLFILWLMIILCV